MEKLNGLDLFSGIGGITYALNEWIKPIAYCEIEKFCQIVLLQRMSEGDLPKAPIWDDIRTLPHQELPKVDIIYGGFPCQDISVAGVGKGLEGERSGLFFEIMRLCGEIRPQFIFLENVPAITTRGGRRVVGEITAMGYDCRWCVISAAGVGALHRRERWFLLANAKHDGASTCSGGGSIRSGVTQGEQHEQKKGIWEIERTSSLSENVANSKSKRLERHRETGEKKKSKPRNESFADGCNTFSSSGKQASQSTVAQHQKLEAWREYSRFYRPFASRDDWQKTVESVGKCIDGISAKLDNNKEQLKSLGNAVVPQQVRMAWEILTGRFFLEGSMNG